MSEQRGDTEERREDQRPAPTAGEPAVGAVTPEPGEAGTEAGAAAAAGAADEQASGAEPESELERVRRERDEYLEVAQRARAELDNFRKRARSEAAGAELRGKAAVARDLIPALDNLERALTAAGVDPSGAVPEGEPMSEEVSARTALAEGVALVYRELRGGIERVGVVAFDPTGERFDPALHEAVATGESDGSDPGLVLETLEKGYRIGDQVLRPARVIVSG